MEQIIRPTGLVDPEVEVRPARTQVDDLLGEIRKNAAAGERVLVTTLTKRMAEDLTEHYEGQGVRVRYLHSDIDTMERVEILRDLRLGTFDVLVGINLLREGLDLPEVSWWRSSTQKRKVFSDSARSLVQTFGSARATSRKGDPLRGRETGSMGGDVGDGPAEGAAGGYNREHGITPETIRKMIAEPIGHACEADYVTAPSEEPVVRVGEELAKTPRKYRKRWRARRKKLDFERAAELRDRLLALEKAEIRTDKRWASRRLETFPRNPGVNHVRRPREVLYVGKAKDLRARVQNYSVPGGDGRRRSESRRADREIRCIVTATEKEAPSREHPHQAAPAPLNIFSADDKEYLPADRPETSVPAPRAGRRAARDGATYSAVLSARGIRKPCGSAPPIPALLLHAAEIASRTRRVSTTRWEGVSARAPASSRGSGTSPSSTTRRFLRGEYRGLPRALENGDEGRSPRGCGSRRPRNSGTGSRSFRGPWRASASSGPSGGTSTPSAGIATGPR